MNLRIYINSILLACKRFEKDNKIGIDKEKVKILYLDKEESEIVVHDIKVIDGEKGLFIAMPSKKATDGEYRGIAHPINSSTRERIQNTILDSYQKALLEPDEE